MKTNHILYTADHNYFPHMLTSIYSLAENNKDSHLTIHIIEDKFTKEDIEFLEQLDVLYGNIIIKMYPFNKLNSLMSEFDIPKWKGTTIANARLFANELIHDVDQILYLDSDTIIVNSLDELFSKKIDTPLAAAKEILIPPHLHKLNNEYKKEDIKKYYNSGVLLFNYDLWYQEDCLDELYAVAQNYNKELIYPDQDLINLAFSNKIEDLSLDYNIIPLAKELEKHKLLARKFLNDRPFYYSYKEVIDSLKNKHIFHALSYLGSQAWEDSKVHPFHQEYLNYRKLWDPNFIPCKEEQHKKYYQIPWISDLNLAVKTLVKEETHNKIKQKLKK